MCLARASENNVALFHAGCVVHRQPQQNRNRDAFSANLSKSGDAKPREKTKTKFGGAGG